MKESGGEWETKKKKERVKFKNLGYFSMYFMLKWKKNYNLTESNITNLAKTLHPFERF